MARNAFLLQALLAAINPVVQEPLKEGSMDTLQTSTAPTAIRRLMFGCFRGNLDKNRPIGLWTLIVGTVERFESDGAL